MATPFDIVTLFDRDNTLLDHDHVVADLRNHLEQEFGPRNSDRYFEIFEALRNELGYADYLGALQRYRLGANNDPRLLKMSCYFPGTVSEPMPHCAFHLELHRLA
jgi:hypothetical protein